MAADRAAIQRTQDDHAGHLLAGFVVLAGFRRHHGGDRSRHATDTVPSSSSPCSASSSRACWFVKIDFNNAIHHPTQQRLDVSSRFLSRDDRRAAGRTKRPLAAQRARSPDELLRRTRFFPEGVLLPACPARPGNPNSRTAKSNWFSTARWPITSCGSTVRRWPVTAMATRRSRRA